MPFCINCGQQLAEGARFCANCGTPVGTAKRVQRETVYEGNLHKCPNCGEVLDSFTANCPACGYELRGAHATDSVKEFERKFNQLTSVERKIDLIKTFAIPNAKEDILEFAVLAAMNINLDLQDLDNDTEDEVRLSNAWLAKLEQTHEKANLLFPSTNVCNKINDIYKKRTLAFESAKKIRKKNKKKEASQQSIVRTFKSKYIWALGLFVFGAIAMFIVKDQIIKIGVGLVLFGMGFMFIGGMMGE